MYRMHDGCSIYILQILRVLAICTDSERVHVKMKKKVYISHYNDKLE
jgi:hypothetical protein